MNRREFIRRGIYLAGTFVCLPSGVVPSGKDSCMVYVREVDTPPDAMARIRRA